MTDLTKGIIEIQGFTITPDTTMDEMLVFFGDKVRVSNLSTGPKIKFLTPFYLTENIYSYAFNFTDSGKIKNFSLIPVSPTELTDAVGIAKYKLSIAKEWLDKTIGSPPNTTNDMCVSYSFAPNCHVGAQCYKDRDYGLVGGEISIIYRR